MNIFNHLIKDEEIVGISPLITLTETELNGSVTVRNHFRIHLKHTSVLITSPDFLSSVDTFENKKWTDTYEIIRRAVAENINEIEAISARAERIEKADEQFKEISDGIREILADLAPTKDILASEVNEKVARLLNNIDGLHDLATVKTY